MRPTVYIETTIPSYLTARPSKDLFIAGLQQSTREWWEQRDEFELFTSRTVIQECRRGDPTAAQDRLNAIADVPLLPDDPLIPILATSLIVGIPLPDKALADAFHIAYSAVCGLQYLLTWNCTHIANAALRKRIEAICRQAGFEPPILCTPNELFARRTNDDAGQNHDGNP